MLVRYLFLADALPKLLGVFNGKLGRDKMLIYPFPERIILFYFLFL